MTSYADPLQSTLIFRSRLRGLIEIHVHQNLSMCTQIKDIRSLYIHDDVYTQVRFSVCLATLLQANMIGYETTHVKQR